MPVSPLKSSFRQLKGCRRTFFRQKKIICCIMREKLMWKKWMKRVYLLVW